MDFLQSFPHNDNSIEIAKLANDITQNKDSIVNLDNQQQEAQNQRNLMSAQLNIAQSALSDLTEVSNDHLRNIQDVQDAVAANQHNIQANLDSSSNLFKRVGQLADNVASNQAANSNLSTKFDTLSSNFDNLNTTFDVIVSQLNTVADKVGDNSNSIADNFEALALQNSVVLQLEDKALSLESKIIELKEKEEIDFDTMMTKVNKLQTLEQSIQTLKNQVDTNINNISAHSSTLAEHYDYIKGLQTSIANHQLQIDQLEADLRFNTQNDQLAQQDVNHLQSQIETHSNTISALNQQIEQAYTSVENNTNNLAALSGRMDDADDVVAAQFVDLKNQAVSMAEDILSVNNDLILASSLLEELDSSVQANSDANLQQNEDIISLQSGYDVLENNSQQLQDQVDNLGNQVSDNADNLSNLGDQVAANSAGVSDLNTEVDAVQEDILALQEQANLFINTFEDLKLDIAGNSDRITDFEIQYQEAWNRIDSAWNFMESNTAMIELVKQSNDGNLASLNQLEQKNLELKEDLLLLEEQIGDANDLNQLRSSSIFLVPLQTA